MAGVKKEDLYFIVKALVVWRLALFLVQYVSFNYLPLQENFLGGGIENFRNNPYFWSYLNFDGEHFLSIAQNGYRDLQYFFFPLYPITTGIIAKFFGGSMFTHALTGLIISHISLLVSLLGIFKIITFDNDKKGRNLIARQAVLLILLFPTSFYFVSFYSEPVFIALAIWSFYFTKTKKWIYAFILSGLATATRVVGLALFTGILIEYILQTRIYKDIDLTKIVRVALLSVLGISGILIYMYYLWVKTEDPLYFFNNVGIYGDQRSAGFILLPQVFYRYVFKIIPNINYNYLPVVFTTWLEFTVATIFGIALGVVTLANLGVKKLKIFKLEWGYFVFALASYIIPTFSGSFSSLPRYVLIIFPIFMLLSKLSYKFTFKRSVAIFSVMSILLMISFSLFIRGYWVS